MLFTNQTLDVKSLEWDFGDGTSKRQTNPSHKYDSLGQYTVCLSPASCDLAGKGSVCETVNITGLNSLYPMVAGNSGTYIGWLRGAGFKQSDLIEIVHAETGETIAADTLYQDN